MQAKTFVTATLVAAVCLVNAAPTDYLHARGVDFKWGSDKVRGVNIGGWLVLEPFITPSIFEKYSTPDWPVVDEWMLCEKLGQSNCAQALKPHWDSFVSLDDFWKIKNAGFNLVRIPVGYWSYVQPWGPYAQGAAPYLDAAIDWARITGLKVIIDLHGAPKSQNGFDHSGHKAAYPAWGDADSLRYTHATLKQIETKYAVPAMQDVIVAIQFLNEPFLQKIDKDMVRQFYRDAFFNLRQISDTPAMLHDGFLDPSWMNGFLTPQDNNAQGVVVDHHEYQIFGDSIGLSVEGHLDLTCNSVDYYDKSDKWTIVGEWSAALTDCAPHLNGFNAGARLDGTLSGTHFLASCAGKSGAVANWTPDYKHDVRRYIATQMQAFEALTNGWIFWNFKTEGGAGEWDLFQLLDEGVWPAWGAGEEERWCRNF